VNGLVTGEVIWMYKHILSLELSQLAKDVTQARVLPEFLLCIHV